MFWNRKPPTKVEIAKRAVEGAIHELSDRAHDLLDSTHVETASGRLSAARQSALEAVVEAERALNAKIASVRGSDLSSKSVDELERAARDARKRAQAEINAAEHELARRKKEAEKQLHLEQKQFESERARLSDEHEKWRAQIAAEVQAAQIEAEKLAAHEARAAAKAQEELERGALHMQKEAEKIAAQAEKEAERVRIEAEKEAARAAHQAEKEAYKLQKSAKKRGREIEVPIGETTILPVEIESGDVEVYSPDGEAEIVVHEGGSRLPLFVILLVGVAALVYFLAPNSGRRSRAAIKDRLGKVKDDIVDASTKSADATASRVEEIAAKSEGKLDDASDAAPGIAAALGEKIESTSDALADKIEDAGEGARDISMMTSDKLNDIEERVVARIDETASSTNVVSSGATSTFDEAVVVDEDIIAANIDEANSEATLQAPENESVTDIVSEAETAVEKIERASKKKS